MNTPLHKAALKGNVDAARNLLEQGANVDETNSDGITPLRLAAEKGHAEVAQLLLEHGANVDRALPEYKSTPLHKAAFNGHLEVAKKLLAYNAKVNATDNTGWSPLHHAAYKGHVELVRLLVEHDAKLKMKQEALTLAAKYGHAEATRVLLKSGAQADAGEEGSALHEAASYTYTTFPVWREKSDKDYAAVIDVLIEHGADVNKACHGNTPLHEAASRHYKVEVAKRLVKHGANVNAKERGTGSTPLHFAVDDNCPNMVRLFVDHGADINAKDKQWRTPSEFVRDENLSIANVLFNLPTGLLNFWKTKKIIRILREARSKNR